MSRALAMALLGLAGSLFVGCGAHTPSSPGSIPVIDATTVKVTKSEHAKPPDPAGILAGLWPMFSSARMRAVAQAAFAIDTGANQVTVISLGAEGQAMGLGESFTGKARDISVGLDLASFAIGYPKGRMTSIAAEGDPADRTKIAELAADLADDLKTSGREAKGEGGDATTSAGR